MDNKMYDLGIKYKTDKVTYHNYHEIYDFFLKSLYNENGSILEIGIANSSSLKMWLELFPNAYIYGMDLYLPSKGNRYNVIQWDQSKIDNLNIVKSQINSKLFFINDDGSHIPEHQLLSFNILFPKLCEGGVYIIEDIETSYWTKGGISGYKTNYGYKNPNSIIEIFKSVIDNINSEFAGERASIINHLDKIGSITFAKNCIIIVKKTQIKRPYGFAENL